MPARLVAVNVVHELIRGPTRWTIGAASGRA